MEQVEKPQHKPNVNSQVLRMEQLGFVTVARAAQLVGIGQARIYALLKGDEPVLKGKQLGKRRYVERASLLAHFNLLGDGTPA